MIRKDKYVEQILSIDQFVFLLSGYISYEQITSVDTIDAAKLLKQLSASDLYNYKKLYEPLNLALFHNSKILKGQLFAPIAESLHFVGGIKRRYKVSHLLNWMESNIELDSLKVHLPEWAKNYIDLPPSKKIENITNDYKGYVKIDTLPKLLQLAIKAHEHFIWEEVDFSSQKGKSDFKKDAITYLNEQASTLKIPHSDKNKQEELGLSTTTLNTFLMAIKPDIE